ncbi:DUF1702 family protein [Streptomyces sp. HPF1205]|uniref:DUF1702 family protein n=1 Tax=Streptomyces sp. HPF1205 TaxID=2873262 RepID=UPI001CEDA522|nr:DUF1702 family protein [Streptomyces sp. HPF1205]
MAGTLRALRRRLLTPDLSEARFATRGFHEKDPAARELLETIGEMFLTGYGYVMEAADPADADQRLEALPRRFRGFAYEGAAMACAMLDALSFGRRARVAALLDRRGREHSYMIHVGAGWAMARLPAFRRSAIVPRDPLLRWLALDGYGFHQAYFHTARYVHERYQDAVPPWTTGGGPQAYAARAIDQGIGRAVWFVGGADPARVADLVDGFPAERRADLYSGVGLAATYAGGADDRELKDLAERAARYRPQVAQGSAFGATARVEAGLVVAETGRATRLLCGSDPETAAAVCARTRPVPVVDHGQPAYETWRTRIAAELAGGALGLA